jgi:hypothetical protein
MIRDKKRRRIGNHEASGRNQSSPEKNRMKERNKEGAQKKRQRRRSEHVDC